MSKDGRYWKDLAETSASDRGNTIIDLVGRTLGCENDLKRICDFCTEYLTGIRPDYDFYKFRQQYDNNRKAFAELGTSIGMNGDVRYANIITDAKDEFTDISLLKYANERGISKETLDAYCKEVTLLNKAKNIQCKAIGFPNGLKDTYIVRNENVKRIATVENNKAHNSVSLISNGSRNLIIFEGFFDMLSYIEMMKYAELDVKSFDYAVLNSDSMENYVVEIGNKVCM